MKRIIDFVADNDVDVVKSTLSREELIEMLGYLSFVPGEQFLGFLEKFSYLAYGSQEFFGISGKLGLKSQMYKRTRLLNENYPSTVGFYIVDSIGDGIYVLVDEKDRIYDFFAGDSKSPEAKEISFCEYVYEKLMEA